jgi:anti-sigma regulatory factor (Ser/Thr protein kinase)
MRQVRFSLPARPESARAARHRVRGLLDSWADEDARHAVLLLVSEVVTNAVRHAPGTLQVTATLGRHRLRAMVLDHSSQLPAMRPDDESGGRGLRLLEALASRWGVQQHPANGKTVWFEVTDDAAAGESG